MFKGSLITFIVLLLSSSIVFAVDDQGNENNPTTNERANACYEDGSMAGKCDSEWEWVCGWYLIQFEYNLSTREEFPNWCISIIPPEIIPEPSIPTPRGGCAYIASTPPQSINFSGGYFLSNPTLYYNSTCAGTPSSRLGNYVYAPAPFDALTLCNLNGTFSGVSSLGYADVYACN